MPKRRRSLYKEEEVIADEPHDGDTIAIVSMSGTCSCSIFVTIKVPTAGFPAQHQRFPFLVLQETYMFRSITIEKRHHPAPKFR